MIEFITGNLATIIVTAILITIVTAIIIKMVRDKKKGVSSCGSCSGCPNAGICHANQKPDL